MPTTTGNPVSTEIKILYGIIIKEKVDGNILWTTQMAKQNPQSTKTTGGYITNVLSAGNCQEIAVIRHEGLILIALSYDPCF